MVLVEYVDWYRELERRDVEGLVEPSVRAFAHERALDAIARIEEDYPLAYKLMPGRSASRRTLVSIVCNAVFSILRNVVNEGRIRETDGVYGFSVAPDSQSAMIRFSPEDIATLTQYENNNHAFGSIRRGGI